MAGSEKAGVMAADPFLFQNAIYILVPGEGVPEDLHAALREMLAQLGAKVLELSAETHDEVVAAIVQLRGAYGAEGAVILLTPADVAMPWGPKGK